jgi:hypothetical protein
MHNFSICARRPKSDEPDYRYVACSARSAWLSRCVMLISSIARPKELASSRCRQRIMALVLTTMDSIRGIEGFDMLFVLFSRR